MRPAIDELEAFYATPRGRLAAGLIERRLEAVRPAERGLRILGLGYAAPFLANFALHAEHVAALMPEEQGAKACRGMHGNVGALVEETTLPLADCSVDVAVLAHAVETSDRVHRLLREVWRVLDEPGRLIVIAPNRRGLWCLAERTPFGYGRPFSASQLKQLLAANLFTPLRHERALYVPPFTSPVWLRTAPAWERVGSRVARKLSGVVILEAEKSVAAGSPVRTHEAVRAGRVVRLPVRPAAARTEVDAVRRHPAPARAVAFTRHRRRA
jgi:SAM-dependent methyltransferase